MAGGLLLSLICRSFVVSCGPNKNWQSFSEQTFLEIQSEYKTVRKNTHSITFLQMQIGVGQKGNTLKELLVKKNSDAGS